MWILPEMDLFASDPILKRCGGRPPGNIPKLCNIDFCINEYLHMAVAFHVRYTHSLHKLDPNFSSIATQKKETSAYL